MVMDTGGSLPPGATAYRVIYDSTSLSGSLVAVSGVIVVPGGAPPPGGFPIVSWAHGTTGLAAACAPSLSGLGSIPSLASLLAARMIVVATDYPGLGVAGPDPYLVGQSEAQSVLDIARAARNLEGQAASNRVVVVGYSQGGQAALFAGQIAPSYAPELFLEGVVAVAPVASITELAPVVPGNRDDPDAGFAVMALSAWSDTYGNIPLDSVLTDQAVREATVMTTACSGAVDTAYDGTPTDRLFRTEWSTTPSLRAADLANQPGHAPTATPVLVVQGTADNLVPYASTTRLVTDSLCDTQHDLVRYVAVPGAGHLGALDVDQPVILRWIAARVAGQVPTDTCPRSLEPALG
jgi:pimeloyl-ACP methyl ester carboxylesterase